LKILFIGYRRIRRRQVHPFFYFPCKFSFKPFFNHFGSKTKLIRINKKNIVYVQKPHLPFNLPRLKKQKFGMMDRAKALKVSNKPRNRAKYKYAAMKRR